MTARAPRRAAKQQGTARHRRQEAQQMRPAAKYGPGVADVATGIVKQARPCGTRVADAVVRVSPATRPTRNRAPTEPVTC
jgi:hypothetical protein